MRTGYSTPFRCGSNDGNAVNLLKISKLILNAKGFSYLNEKKAYARWMGGKKERLKQMPWSTTNFHGKIHHHPTMHHKWIQQRIVWHHYCIELKRMRDKQLRNYLSIWTDDANFQQNMRNFKCLFKIVHCKLWRLDRWCPNQVRKLLSQLRFFRFEQTIFSE